MLCDIVELMDDYQRFRYTTIMAADMATTKDGLGTIAVLLTSPGTKVAAVLAVDSTLKRIAAVVVGDFGDGTSIVEL
jgi:hypothetical protein